MQKSDKKSAAVITLPWVILFIGFDKVFEPLFPPVGEKTMALFCDLGKRIYGYHVVSVSRDCSIALSGSRK